MDADPDYSATYVVLHTDSGYEGHGLAFTIGRGNEVVVAGVKALAPRVVGKTLESFTENMGAFWRMITGDSQLRWVGPEKGVIHLATAAIVNAVWDLWAKVEGKPLWKLLVDLSPEELVRCVDFRYITDAITPDEALALLKANAATRPQREAEMLAERLSGLHHVERLARLQRRQDSPPLPRSARRRLDAFQNQSRRGH